MPMTIPPWIRPASPEYYMQGFSQGEGIAERQNRAEAAIQEMTMRREAQQRQDQMAAVNLVTSLQHMALAKQASDEKAREAALKWQWQQDLSGRINAGEDPVTAWENSTARYNPQAYGTYAIRKRQSELAAEQRRQAEEGRQKRFEESLEETKRYHSGMLSRSDVVPETSTMTNPVTGQPVGIAHGGGRWQVLPDQASTQQKALKAIEDETLKKQQKDIEDLLGQSPSKREATRLQGELTKVKTARSNLVMQAGSPLTPPPTTGLRSNEIIRVIKSTGQRAVFDKDTKAFIRYAD